MAHGDWEGSRRALYLAHRFDQRELVTKALCSRPHALETPVSSNPVLHTLRVKPQATLRLIGGGHRNAPRARLRGKRGFSRGDGKGLSCL
jgi:hypothetical protein